MGVHRDTFDSGLCSNMTVKDAYSFQAMDLQYDKANKAMMIRYCTVNAAYFGDPGQNIGCFVGCLDYILQLFSIQSTGIVDGSKPDRIYFGTSAGSDMLVTKDQLGYGMYYVNVTNKQNTVLQVNIASSASVQKSVPNEAEGNMSPGVTDFSMIHTDTRNVPAAQTLYTSLLSRTLADWQKPQVRAPVAKYSTAFSKPWIKTRTLIIAIGISLVAFVLSLCIEQWFVSPYYTTTFMNNVIATTCGEGTTPNVLADIQESSKEGVPAHVTLNSRRLTLEYSEKGIDEENSLIRGFP